jgi:hypothetical protein
VGPEYSAIMGVALGIDQRARQPVLRGLLALLAGFSAAIVVTLLFALVIRWSGHTPKLYSLGVRPVSSLIDNPNWFSIVVAVLAGIVGVVSLTEARASALIGVFISVTTIPAGPKHRGLRQGQLPTCRVSEVQATDDRRHEPFWRAIGGTTNEFLGDRGASRSSTWLSRSPAGKKCPCVAVSRVTSMS